MRRRGKDNLPQTEESEIEELEPLENADGGGPDDDFELMTRSEIDALKLDDDEPSELEIFAERFFDTSLQSKIPMFMRLTRRSVVFLFLMLLAFITFFIIGNHQKFLDSNLKLILSLATANAIMLAIMSAFAFLESIICIATERKLLFVFYSLAFTLSVAFASSTGVLSAVLNALSDGFSP
ncbi:MULTISPECIES: hypothetical protein [Treponema]|uniref:Uncharacterized protein n=1 Tax=Treponema saccharophilum DSM 2985 TaxID=907348 RepID=H7EMQ7_9SPIR|nr:MULTISPECIES: hypothetical protein [Treponema]EIC01153.1 hypothetical protein TresaDRAFT_0290 [Treponema saccharophilum DSM 2985]MBQ5536621.1 hypothetical protein [Treponema sp.]BDC95907.1 hypothetical protein TRSA_10060 [Treponema saccharophilum]